MALAKCAVVAVLLVLSVWGRAYLLQRGHFMEAEKYLKEENFNLKFALREYDAAMHFYAPFSPYTEKSAGRLWQIGTRYEEMGGLEMAVVSYSSIRSSFYASRGIITPGGEWPGMEWIKKCDKKMAALNVKIALKEGRIRESDAALLESKYLELLGEDRSPSVLWSCLALSGFFGWTASAVFMIFRGFTEKAATRGRNLLYGVLAFAAMFALWAIALLRA